MSHRAERVDDDSTPDESRSESFWWVTLQRASLLFGLDYLTVGGCGSLAIW